MEFIRGDVNELVNTIAGYKLTISIDLSTITILVAIPYLLRVLLTSFLVIYL